MKLDLIPIELRDLVFLVEKWGLSDDGYRDEQINYGTDGDLMEIVKSLSDDKLEILNDWLESNASNAELNISDEFINFTCYLMAFEYASVILEKRNNQLF